MASLHPATRATWAAAFCLQSAGLLFEWHVHHLPQRSGPASPWQVHCWSFQAVRVQHWGPSCLAAQGTATAPHDSLITSVDHVKWFTWLETERLELITSQKEEVRSENVKSVCNIKKKGNQTCCQIKCS